MKRIKIMIVYKSMDVGGVEKMIVRLLRNLDKNIFDTELVLFAKKGTLLSEIPRSTKTINLKVGDSFIFLNSVINLIKKINIEKPEALLCFGDYPGVIVAVASVFCKTKPRVIVEMPNLMSKWVRYQKLPVIRNLAIRFILWRANKVIAVSKAVKNDLAEKYGINRKKIKVIYNFLEKKEYILPQRDNFRKPSELPILLYAGRLVKQKNVDVVIQAMAYIKRELKSKLLIVGGGREKNKLVLMVKRLGLENDVEFFPLQPNIRNKLASASLLILNSSTEGHPCTVLESMAIGTPVLTTEYSGSEELIKNNKTGFTIPLNTTPMELAKKIVKLIVSKKKLQTVSKRAKNFVKNYSVDKQINKYDSILIGE